LVTPLNTGTLSTTPVAFWIEKKPSPVIAMLVATVEPEIVPCVDLFPTFARCPRPRRKLSRQL